MTATLAALLADKDARSNAIAAPGREWLSYGALRALSAEVEAQLRGFGIGASDRVAIVLPNGPEMAAAFVTIAQAAVTAPLNPAYHEKEYSFYLEDLRAKALVVPADYDGPALAAAAPLGMAILRLHTQPDQPAGQFCLSGTAGFHRADPPYLGHHVAAQDCAASAIEPRRVGAQHRHFACADAR